MVDIIEEEKRKQFLKEAKEVGIDKIKADLIEIEEHIKEEEKRQKEKTIQYTNEEVVKAKENDDQILKCFLEWSKMNERIDQWVENGKPEDTDLKKEYLDTLVKFSKLIETSPLYDIKSYKSEEAIKRFTMLTAIDSYDPRDPLWSEYLAQYLKKMGLYHVFAYRCKRCDHVWFPEGFNPMENILRVKPPKSCARCKSKYWNSDPKRKTKHVTVNQGILEHDKLTQTQIKNMIRNVDRFVVHYANHILPKLEKIMIERNEIKKEEKQVIVVTNRKKKKCVS